MPLATTKIWPVRDSLRRVVDYTANPDKTEYSGLAQALHYAENDAKTTLRETAQLVSGVHCRPGTAWAEMRAVQEQFGKTEGVVAMHAYQSFKPGEVTPEQCHSIGVELARRVWGGRFQVLVATHLPGVRSALPGARPVGYPAARRQKAPASLRGHGPDPV